MLPSSFTTAEPARIFTPGPSVLPTDEGVIGEAGTRHPQGFQTDRGETEPSHQVSLDYPGTDWEDLEPQGFYGRVGRPLLDLALVLACTPAVIAVSVPLALANWAVHRSWRKILFRQVRVGQRGERFVLYKFRTMRDAEGGEYESWKEGDQGRVTRLGTFLRKSHLDEIPQIINILLGEMTFIGPRPEMVETHAFACDAIPQFERRLVLRPGITGRAQITGGYAGHNAEEYRRKLKEDEFYRAHFSLRADMAILVKTPVWMLRMRGWLGPEKSPHPAPVKGPVNGSVKGPVKGSVKLHEVTVVPAPRPALNRPYILGGVPAPPTARLMEPLEGSESEDSPAQTGTA